MPVHLDPHDFVSWHEWIVRLTSNHASLSALEETMESKTFDTTLFSQMTGEMRQAMNDGAYLLVETIAKDDYRMQTVITEVVTSYPFG